VRANLSLHWWIILTAVFGFIILPITFLGGTR
jgi:hypothetical protein